MGQGIDRHLLGLKLQAIENGLSVPRIFMDTAYGLATHWKLRTGQVTDGFGCIQTTLIHEVGIIFVTLFLSLLLQSHEQQLVPHFLLVKRKFTENNLK